ncbi:hypothetical protein B0H15DRAFT_787992 [Mycena belliarum]|uniref:Uncharacterized protein n=1 Tax=Mycena belliarum TaxID=1033014 RepID=A0AAD6TX52_9AGAR|nr:hypothetical protein B0H15DRAFT_787992 [Mycena belliae]
MHAEPPVSTAIDASDLPATHGAYGAKANDKEEAYGRKKRRSLPELIGMGFELVPWNGVDPRPIVDMHGRIVAVLAGQPRDPTYAADAAAAFAAMQAEAADACFPSSMSKHRRGLFPAINAGLYYGKGTRTACRLDNGKKYNAIADRLLDNPAFKRLASFADASFALWAPLIYQLYQQHDHSLRKRFPHLRRNFVGSVFSCAAFNFGPNVWTFKHRDDQNLGFGWCAVQAVGPFDPTKGGHLVLWDLKLVVEFPPGATILLPSATVAHSNLPVQAGDKRASFTQYTPGGLIRFVDNGFRTEKDLAAQDPEEYERMRELKGSRWERGIGLFSTIDSLLEPL